MVRTFSELCSYPTFEERLDYLMLKGSVGVDTFGHDRIFNQKFYRSNEWKRIRNFVIARDNGCDLGVQDGDHYIYGKILVHHMNPITIDDIREGSPYLLDPEYLITVSEETHNAITYGVTEFKQKFKEVVRFKNDTCPWRK